MQTSAKSTSGRMCFPFDCSVVSSILIITVRQNKHSTDIRLFYCNCMNHNIKIKIKKGLKYYYLFHHFLHF